MEARRRKSKTLYGKNKYMKQIILLLVIFHFTNVEFVKSQKLRLVKRNLKILCSEKFAGRGYSNNGDKIASDFIVKKLRHYKAKTFKANSYLQSVPISVNTFPGKMSVKLNNGILRPQYDYLVSANSQSVSGKYPVIRLSSEKFAESYNNKYIEDAFLLIDTLNIDNKELKEAYNYIVERNPFKAKGIITVEHKALTHVPSQRESDFAHVKIAAKSLPENIDSIEIDVENKFFENYISNNIAAYIEGKSDSFIVLSAHYDHLGEMGKSIYFPGANDNGSGVVALLDLLRHYSKNRKNLKYSIAFLFFTGEELGLLGSFYYVNNPLFPLDKIKLLINLDMVGSGDKGIKVVNGSVFKSDFNKLVEINNKKSYLSGVFPRAAAANSDHFPFYHKGVKSFFIYTLGEYKEYHSVHDNAKNLPFSKYKALFRLLIDYIEEI